MTDELRAAPCSGGWEDIRAWRKETRRALIARRVALAPHVRRVQAEQARQRLAESVDLRQYGTVGFYWPIQGEINCRSLIRTLIGAGRTVALPVVVERGKAVEFWKWQPGAAMQKGLWDIPIPEIRDVVQPDALVIPLVGFDAAGYRLGYGGGYYDRTIAGAARKPFCIGLGFSLGMLPSICPQPHDMPMDIVATDRILVRYGASAEGRVPLSNCATQSG